MDEVTAARRALALMRSGTNPPPHLRALHVRKPPDFAPMSDEIIESTCIRQFEMVVERQPDHPALRLEAGSLTYRQLNNAANFLANRIILEAGSDRSPVAILLEDVTALVVTMLAVAKSGRPYMMLYPGAPEEELQTQLADAGAALLVTTANLGGRADQVRSLPNAPRTLLAETLQAEQTTPNPLCSVEPNGPFAIYYTSGSTGRPKGALDGHLMRSVTCFRNVNDYYWAPSDRVPLMTSPWHAAAMSTVLATFTSGATLYPYDVSRHSAEETLQWLQGEQISILWCTPSTFRSVFRIAPAGFVFPAIRFMRLAGEALTGDDLVLVKEHTAEDCLLMHSYASSEAGVVAEMPLTHATPAFSGPVPPGYPWPGVEIVILDEKGSPAAAGESGEICVSSPYMSLGYWNDPELTQRVFQAHPADPQQRLCHTGDMGRWRSDGALEVLGRKDTQVKIRGFRVHLEAVDLALRSLEGVADAASQAVWSTSRGARLAAYVTMAPGHSFSVTRLREQLALKLPSHAVPSMFVEMETLPRTTTGKLARTKLPTVLGRRPAMDHPYVAPRSGLEQDITRIWERVLEIEGIGVHDSFFDLGGDSLMTLELTLELEKSLNKPIPRAFLKMPTVSALAGLLEDPASAQADDDLFAVARGPRTRLQRMQELMRKLSPAKLRRAARWSYAGEKVDQLFDAALAGHVASMPYLAARDWAVQWSRNPLVRKALYQRRAALFARWVDSVGGRTPIPSEVFELSVLRNVLHGSVADASRRLGDAGRSVQAYKDSPLAYWRTLGEMLKALPADELSEEFPMRGLDHLMTARQKGHGVILLSFHGFPVKGGLMILRLLLGLSQIPTISFRVPRSGTKYAADDAKIPVEETAALNAQIALLGQKTLQEGGIINFASDWADAHGRPYRVPVGGRLYAMKAGFAELAVNTGATIVPYLWRCLPDGRLQMEFEAPFEVGNGERAEQVEQLVGKYGSFIRDSFARYPESMKWSDILSHFRRPASSEDP